MRRGDANEWRYGNWGRYLSEGVVGAMAQTRPHRDAQERLFQDSSMLNAPPSNVRGCYDCCCGSAPRSLRRRP